MDIKNMILKEWMELEITSVEQARNLIGEENLKSCLLDCCKDKPDEIESYDMDDIFDIGADIISQSLDKYFLFGRYVFPMCDVDYKVSDIILKAIKSKYVLTINVQSDKSMCYVLEPLTTEGLPYKISKDWSDMIKDYLHSCGCPFFLAITLDAYFDSELYQKAIDKVLLLASNRTQRGYSLGLRLRGNTLMFVEERLK